MCESRSHYAKGIQVTEQEMQAINLTRPNSAASGTTPLLQTNNLPEAVSFQQALRENGRHLPHPSPSCASATLLDWQIASAALRE